MYQILFKIPNTIYDEQFNIIEQHSNPTETFRYISLFCDKVGQIHASNDEYSCFGFIDESNVINVPNLPSDVVVEITSIK